jgi:Flp pilus assembly protein TadG
MEEEKMNIASTKRIGFRRGMAIVEAAILFPVLLMVTFGMMEYGWMFLKMQQLNNVAEVAARMAAMPTATNTTVTSEITTLMSGYGMGSSGYTTTFTPSDVSTAAAGATVQVQLSVSYANVKVVGSGFVPTPSTINASVTMVKE